MSDAVIITVLICITIVALGIIGTQGKNKK